MRRSFPLLSLTISASLVCTPLLLPQTAEASPLTINAPEAAPADEDPALTEAKSLYKQGEVEFQTGGFLKALGLWKQAFAMLPDGEDNRAIRHALVYNIAEAHSRAYEVSRNLTHLRTAKVMLETYRKEHLALYGDDKDAVKERSEVDDRIAEIDKKIEAGVAAGEQATPIEDEGGAAGPGPETGPQPQPVDGPQPQPVPDPTLTPQQQWDAEVKADPNLGPLWEKGNKQVVGGAILLGIGVPFLGGGIATFVAAARAQAAANIVDPADPLGVADVGAGILWASASVLTIVGLGLSIPGAVLLPSGLSKRKQVLSVKPKPTAQLVPHFSPRGGGLNLHVRF